MKEAGKGLCVAAIVCIVFLLWLHQEEEFPLLWHSGKEQGESEKTETSRQVHVTRQDGSELYLDMEAYLIGVLSSEMPAEFEMEALKAQSVAARTYVVQRGYEVDDTTSTQVYHDEGQLKKLWGDRYNEYHERISNAVKETAGEILTYQDKAISALFYSSSCGKSANAKEYWGNEVPYLKSVDSHWDKEEKGYMQSVVISEQEFAEKLGFVNPVKQIKNRECYDSGYVKSIEIDQISFSGRQIREKLGLRSSCFTIEKKEKAYRITTKGYGHGVGMSQYGAQGMAKEGKSYEEILLHYYQGAVLKKENS